MAKKQKSKKDTPSFPEVDLAKLFKAKPLKDDEQEKPIETRFEYEKKLPAGVVFSARFVPKENWKKGLAGFNIHGLKRSKMVLRTGDCILDRDETIAMIKTLLKPGDASLEDVRLFITEKTAKKAA